MVDRRRTRWLYGAVILAIALGIVLGLVDPETGAKMKPLGDGFIKLIKMTIAPLIFCTVVAGIAGMTNMKSVGKVGGLALLYFEVMSTVALIIGLVIVNVMKPGVGMNLDGSIVVGSMFMPSPGLTRLTMTRPMSSATVLAISK